MEKFLNKKVDYFWEYDYSFGTIFLKSIFDNQYKRKYSLTGDGIFNLILIDNKIYDVRLKETKTMLENDNKKAFRDETKDIVINKICGKLKELNLPYTRNGGKFITFKLGKFIAKVEIVKKAAMPT